MALDVNDAASSFLKARAEFNTWADQFMARWTMPEQVLYMTALLRAAGTQGLLQNPEASIKTDMLVKKLLGKR